MTISKTLKRSWMSTTAACLLTCLGAVAALAQQGDASGAMDHSGMSPGGSSTEPSGHRGMDQGGMNHGGMGQGGMMGHGGAGQGGMMGRGGGMSGGMGHGGGMGGGMGHGGMMGHGGGMGGMMGQGKGGMDRAQHGERSGHGMMMGHMMCRTTEHVEGRLAYLKAELKLVEAQTSQWNAFANAFRSATQKAGQFCASMHERSESESSKMSGGTLQQLGVMERMMTAHLEEVRAIKAAAEPLFNVLSDEQKKMADETMTDLMGLGMGKMGGMGKM
jgi:hypothetical protein